MEFALLRPCARLGFQGSKPALLSPASPIMTSKLALLIRFRITHRPMTLCIYEFQTKVLFTIFRRKLDKLWN